MKILKRRTCAETYALDQLSSIDTKGLISRRELMRRASVFGAAATLGAFGGVLGSGTYRLSAYCDIGVSGSWHTPTQAHQGSLDVTLSLTSQQGNTYR